MPWEKSSDAEERTSCDDRGVSQCEAPWQLLLKSKFDAVGKSHPMGSRSPFIEIMSNEWTSIRHRTRGVTR